MRGVIASSITYNGFSLADVAVPAWAGTILTTAIVQCNTHQKSNIDLMCNTKGAPYTMRAPWTLSSMAAFHGNTYKVNCWWALVGNRKPYYRSRLEIGLLALAVYTGVSPMSAYGFTIIWNCSPHNAFHCLCLHYKAIALVSHSKVIPCLTVKFISSPITHHRPGQNFV